MKTAIGTPSFLFSFFGLCQILKDLKMVKAQDTVEDFQMCKGSTCWSNNECDEEGLYCA